MSSTPVRDSLAGATPSRRTVVRASAWTAPAVMVAVAAPAFAACSPASATTVSGVLDWDARSGVAFSRSNDRRSVSATYSQAGRAPLLVSVSTKYYEDMQIGPLSGTNQNFDRPTRIGGLQIGGLAMHQSNTRKKPRKEKDRRIDRGEYTFTFGRPVKNLSFYLTDIDAATGDFRDAVQLTSGFGQLLRAKSVEGSGTESNPYQSSTTGALQDNVNGGGGNVRVVYPGLVSSVTVTYWNIQDAFDTNTDQITFISDLTFDYSPIDGCSPMA